MDIFSQISSMSGHDSYMNFRNHIGNVIQIKSRSATPKPRDTEAPASRPGLQVRADVSDDPLRGGRCPPVARGPRCPRRPGQTGSKEFRMCSAIASSARSGRHVSDGLPHGRVLGHGDGAVDVCGVEAERVQVAVGLREGVPHNRVPCRREDGVMEAGVMGHEVLPKIAAVLHPVPERRQLLFQCCRPGWPDGPRRQIGPPMARPGAGIQTASAIRQGPAGEWCCSRVPGCTPPDCRPRAAGALPGPESERRPCCGQRHRC